MITLITGAPGTGKSAALVDLLSSLSKNRVVYVSGIPDLQIEHQVLEDPTTWPDTVPDGSIIVVDEVQRVWRPRGPGSKVPLDISALETHRHRGLDFYIVTQAPRLVDGNIRGLVGRHIHLRDLGIIGRFWYEWPECAESCASSWKNAPLKKRFRLPKSAFSLYKSASLHVKPIRSFPWMLAVLFLALALSVVLAYKAYKAISSKMSPLPSAVSPVPVAGLDGIIQRRSESLIPVVIYDTAAWTPRVSSRPESAPLYDHLRQVVSMPIVVGGYCDGPVCKCITQQGTDSGLSATECRNWTINKPFNPYAPTGPIAAPAASQSAGSSSPPDRHPSLTAGLPPSPV